MTNLTKRLFSTKTVPEVQYFVIPKCGCTFVKNVLWRIDNDFDHERPLRIHDDDFLFPRADTHGYSEKSIRLNPYAFTVLRNPVDRFVSLYFDKIVGEGHKEFVPLRRLLIEKYNMNPKPITAEDHHANCMISLDWISKNLKHKVDIKPDPHWTPQSWRLDVMKTFDLKILVLHKLDQKISILLRPIVPNIQSVLAGIERNKSKKPIGRDQLVDDELRSKVFQIYSTDIKLIKSARLYWDKNTPGHSDDIPTISQL